MCGSFTRYTPSAVVIVGLWQFVCQLCDLLEHGIHNPEPEFAIAGINSTRQNVVVNIS